MIPFVFFGSCIGSVLTAALLHWMYQGAFAKWEGKALAKLARLRLTDEEREAIVRARHALLKLAAFEKPMIEVHLADARTINGLLERTKNG